MPPSLCVSLSSQLAPNKPVKARVSAGLGPFSVRTSVNPFDVFPPRSTEGRTGVLHVSFAGACSSKWPLSLSLVRSLARKRVSLSLARKRAAKAGVAALRSVESREQPRLQCRVRQINTSVRKWRVRARSFSREEYSRSAPRVEECYRSKPETTKTSRATQKPPRPGVEER